jgi:DNA segregation ATPase FtsK/SpoIIIE, S-DNA-T family
MTQISYINNLLSSFKIGAICQNYTDLPFTRYYDLRLNPGTRIQQIEKYSSELALALQIDSLPTLKPLNGKGLLRLEFIKTRSSKLDLFRLGKNLSRPVGESPLACLLGEMPDGVPLWMSLDRYPHLLVSGCTGSGKSTLLHTFIANFLLQEVQLILLDPKHIEFYQYDTLNYSNIKVSYDYQDCLHRLDEVSKMMERRYLQMRQNQSRDQENVVVIIDEFADLIQQDESGEFQALLCKLAQKSRAAGIYLILGTQRPSVDVVSGSIKSNFPSRISCKVATAVDSRVVLDTVGAQHLLGNGDALIRNGQYELQRFQVAWTSPDRTKQFLNLV